MGVISKEDVIEVYFSAYDSLVYSLGSEYDGMPDWLHLTESNFGLLEVCPSLYDGQLHDFWMSDMLADGWTFGEVIDYNKKEHPCIVPFDYLSEQDKAKTRLFTGIVRALAPLVG